MPADADLIAQTFDLGRDRYGRQVRAYREKDGGQWWWRIESDPVSQRDDGERMRSLTDENIRRLKELLDK